MSCAKYAFQGYGTADRVLHCVMPAAQVPDMPLEDVDRAAADSDLVNQLEQYMAEWSQVGARRSPCATCFLATAAILALDHGKQCTTGVGLTGVRMCLVRNLAPSRCPK